MISVNKFLYNLELIFPKTKFIGTQLKYVALFDRVFFVLEYIDKVGHIEHVEIKSDLWALGEYSETGEIPNHFLTEAIKILKEREIE